MKHINFANIEELVFEDEELQRRLPSHMFSYFEQWRMGKRIPMLRQMGRQAMFDLLSVLDEAIETLEDYFDETVFVETLNYNIVQNLKIPLAETKICEELCKMSGFSYCSTWRDNEHLYISMWK